MSYRSIFDAKTASETVAVSFDFASEYAIGETVASASVGAAVYSGIDATPSALLSGTPTLSGAVVTQTLAGGVVGVTYLITATALSSLGKTRSLAGYVSVTA